VKLHRLKHSYMAHADNKKAFHDYEILERVEAGIKLEGHEVKSVRNGNISLKGTYVALVGGEAYLLNAHIAKYRFAGALPGYEPDRSRKLLLSKKEIAYLRGKSQERGLTIVPLRVYTKGRYIKVEIAVAKGKKSHDKRESLKRRDVDREMRRAMKV
jgi:SsrA-binding protein